jgi:hypothetical protein
MRGNLRMILLELRNIYDYRAKAHNEHRAYSMAIEPQFRALDRSDALRASVKLSPLGLAILPMPRRAQRQSRSASNPLRLHKNKYRSGAYNEWWARQGSNL